MDYKHGTAEVKNPEGSVDSKLDTLPVVPKKDAPTVSMVETRKMTPAERTHCASKIQSIISTLALLFSFYGFRLEGYKAGNTVRWWLELCERVGGRNAWLKITKYKISAFFAKHMGQPLPKAPFIGADHAGILLGNRAYRWMNLFLDNATEEERVSFLTSVLYSKKGFPRPDKLDCKLAAKEAVTKLTSAKLVQSRIVLRQWADADELNSHQVLTLTKDMAKAELRRSVVELFQGHKYSISDRTKIFVPSTRANIQLGREELGTIGVILANKDLLRGLRSSGRFLFKFNEVREKEEGMVPDGGKKEYDVDASVVRRRFSSLYWRILKRANEEQPFASPVALPEPLKVRVITKGPPLTYAALTPLQKFMWRVLKNHKAFKLIGEPVSEGILKNTLGRIRQDQYFLSGDYTDATNELHSWVSQTIAIAIGDVIGLNDTETDLFVKALVQHVLIDDEGKAHEQVTGQLMGSVVSFPVLCIANAAMTRFAMEQAEGKKIPFSNIRALFNGDDIVAVTSKLGYDLWRKCTGFIGLQESVGKTYLSTNYLNINSTSFVFNERHRVVPKPYSQLREGFAGAKELGFKQQPFVVDSNPYRQVPYVNLGLLKGLKRAGGAIDPKRVISEDNALGPRVRELIRLGPSQMRDKLIEEFVRFNKAKLEKLKGLPYFISEEFGGLGIPTYISSGGEMQGPSIWELRCAANILRNHPDVMRRGTEASWQLHALALRMLPEQPIQVLNESQDEKYRTLYGYLCSSVLFDENLGPADLFRLESGERKQVRHNQAVWRRVKPLPKGMSFDAERLVAMSKHTPHGIAVRVLL